MEMELDRTDVSQRNVSIARLLVVAAALLWSISGALSRFPQLDMWAPEVRGGVIAFWRALFASFLLIPLIRRPRFRPFMIVLVVAFAGMVWTFLTALTCGPPENAIWLQNLAPVWVMLSGLIFLRERATRDDWIMLGLCTTGVLIILSMQLWLGSQPEGWWAIFLALLSSVLYAVVVLCFRILKSEDSAWLVMLSHLGTVVCLFPFVLSVNIWPSGNTWLLLIAFGIFQIGLPYLFFARALRSIPGHEASLIALIEPIALPLWVYLVWNGSAFYQFPRWWTFVGGAFILVGLAYRFMRQRAGY
jgi:drug/metabolite transporter (DMT)-like permease